MRRHTMMKTEQRPPETSQVTFDTLPQFIHYKNEGLLRHCQVIWMRFHNLIWGSHTWVNHAKIIGIAERVTKLGSIEENMRLVRLLENADLDTSLQERVKNICKTLLYPQNPISRITPESYKAEPDLKLYSDVQWEALVQVAKKDNQAKAKEIAAATLSGNPAPYPCSWKSSTKSIDSFFDKLFLTSEYCLPQYLSSLGLLESIGLREHNKYLDNVSPDAVVKRFENKKANLKELRQYSLGDLTPEQLVTFKICSWSLNLEMTREQFLFHDYKVNQLEGVLQFLSPLFTIFHKLEVLEDFENYNTRLRKIPEQFAQTIELMKHQQKMGILPPRFALEKAIEIMKKFTAVSSTENEFYVHLKKNVEKSFNGHAEQLLSQTQGILEKEVYPAYKSLQDHCSSLLPLVTRNDGVWALPKGDAYYDYTLRFHTTTDLSADQIHELGLKEVRHIHDEMRLLLSEVGKTDPTKSVGILIQELSKEDRFFYSNTDEGRKECLDGFSSILERCRKELWPLFDIKPKAKVKIQAVPKHEEEGAPAAYYYSPSIDGSRPGVFFVNMFDMRQIPKFGMETLSVHEAEPGHHFQFALMNEMDIPILRKLGESTAYCEGWALYTEKLAYEQGFFKTPYDKLGHLQDELLRATRLVVDTGIHRNRWTREQAIEYMEQATGYAHDMVVSEVERYFVLPGQACAYKIGQLKILELRQKAKDKLGVKFDIKEFHNVVLQLGTVPLAILEEAVENYIQKKSSC